MLKRDDELLSKTHVVLELKLTMRSTGVLFLAFKTSDQFLSSPILKNIQLGQAF